MNRISLAAITVLAATVMSVISTLEHPETLEAQPHTAARSFQEEWAAPGSKLQVTITASDYGDFGQVVEDLPDGFTFIGSSLDEAHIEIDGQTVRFNLLRETGFTYRVNVPTTEGQYTFSGVIKNVDREEQAIGGHASLRVGPAPTQNALTHFRPRVYCNDRTNSDTGTHSGAHCDSGIDAGARCDSGTDAGTHGNAGTNT